MDYGLIGYKKNDNIGDFLAERNTKEELESVKEQAIKNGYVKFQYVYADGSKPDFTKTINI